MVLVLSFIALAFGPMTHAQGPTPGPAPLLLAPQGDALPGRYIVVLKESPAARANRLALIEFARSLGSDVSFQYSAAINGFAAVLPPQALQALRSDPNVAYIEQEQFWRVDGDQSPSPWNIDRIDQRDLPLGNSFHWDVDGGGVHAYILDTGIRITHSEFGGRAAYAFNALSASDPDDDHGHGTHIAGILGGATYGVAKGVSLHAVKVCDYNGSCPTSAVVAGLDWVTANHESPAVANMSLGGSPSTAIDDALRNSIDAGVTYAVAAGNDDDDACRHSPARVDVALTVGASTSSDARAPASNYGACVDIFAPGWDIPSAWNSSDRATHTQSGTSMASPHVAGVSALLVAANPDVTPAGIKALLQNSTVSAVGDGLVGVPPGAFPQHAVNPLHLLVVDQEVTHRVGPRLREALVGALGAHRVGVAVHVDLGDV